MYLKLPYPESLISKGKYIKTVAVEKPKIKYQKIGKYRTKITNKLKNKATQKS